MVWVRAGGAQGAAGEGEGGDGCGQAGSAGQGAGGQGDRDAEAAREGGRDQGAAGRAGAHLASVPVSSWHLAMYQTRTPMPSSGFSISARCLPFILSAGVRVISGGRFLDVHCQM